MVHQVQLWKSKKKKNDRRNDGDCFKKQSVGDVKWPDYHAQVIKKNR